MDFYIIKIAIKFYQLVNNSFNTKLFLRVKGLSVKTKKKRMPNELLKINQLIKFYKSTILFLYFINIKI
jgi:hypothetical protein